MLFEVELVAGIRRNRETENICNISESKLLKKIDNEK